MLWALVLSLSASATTPTPNPSAAPASANAHSPQQSPASPPASPQTATPPSTTAPIEGRRADLLPASGAAARGGNRNNPGLSMSVQLRPLSVPAPDDVLSVHRVVTSVTFWTTLLGALTAFALGRFGQWRSTLNERRAAGNLTIVTLAEMYSEAKALYDSVFVVGAEELREKLGRELRLALLELEGVDRGVWNQPLPDCDRACRLLIVLRGCAPSRRITCQLFRRQYPSHRTRERKLTPIDHVGELPGVGAPQSE